MPHNPKLTPKPHAFPRLFGQRPLTVVKNYAESIKVDLVQYPNMTTAIDGLYDFAKATWSEDGHESDRASYEEKQEVLAQMLQGKSLQLGLETIQFIFRISGITRLDTHQIVRQRVGVTFSQQCSGDQFWTHHNVLVEPSIHFSEWNHTFFEEAIETKMAYAGMLDSMKISVQAARSILPHCLDTFIFMKVDLATLLFFHQKRVDNGSQTWQMNEISNQMAAEVIKVFPDLKETFEKNKTRFKFQVEASKDRKNTLSTGLYLPDPDNFEYHEQDFLYQQTKHSMHMLGTTFPDSYYWGSKSISKTQYDEIDLAYDTANREVEREGLINLDILNYNLSLNEKLKSKLGI